MSATITPQRDFLETTFLPRFAAGFAVDARVLNIGAGDHPYHEYFPCPVVTSDRDATLGCEETYPAEAIPYADGVVDGILLIGVVERLDDPMQALRECQRVLKRGGRLLLGLAGIDFPWRKPADRWRLTPSGAAYLVRGFDVIDEHHVERVYHFYVVQK